MAGSGVALSRAERSSLARKADPGGIAPLHLAPAVVECRMFGGLRDFQVGSNRYREVRDPSRSFLLPAHPQMFVGEGEEPSMSSVEDSTRSCMVQYLTLHCLPAIPDHRST